MNVPVHAQLGLRGPGARLRPILLDVSSIGAVSSWAGSYHVLAMARHYDDYVITGRLIGLPVITGIPVAHPYQRLTGKIRAAGVTGNIGECVAALFARRHLGAGIGDIAHVRPRQPFQRRKAPDYMMRLQTYMPGPFGSILPQLAQPFKWPVWFPVESKARSTAAGCKSAQKDALKQLMVYWSLIANSQPDAVGYGLIVTFAYNPPREVSVILVCPRDQAALTAELKLSALEINETVANRSLYGCGY